MAEKDYIDRERLFNALNAYNTKFNAEINSIIISIPKEDVQEVRHGKWIEYDNGVQTCSECGEEHEWQDYRASYCEDCGAKMDKE